MASMLCAKSLKFWTVCDQVSPRPVAELGGRTYAENIVHERSSSRAKLDQLDALLFALAEPLCDKPDAHQFTKYL